MQARQISSHSGPPSNLITFHRFDFPGQRDLSTQRNRAATKPNLTTETRRHGENQNQRQTLYNRGHGGKTEGTEEIHEKNPMRTKIKENLHGGEEFDR